MCHATSEAHEKQFITQLLYHLNTTMVIKFMKRIKHQYQFNRQVNSRKKTNCNSVCKYYNDVISEGE